MPERKPRAAAQNANDVSQNRRGHGQEPERRRDWLPNATKLEPERGKQEVRQQARPVRAVVACWS